MSHGGSDSPNRDVGLQTLPAQAGLLERVSSQGPLSIIPASSGRNTREGELPGGPLDYPGDGVTPVSNARDKTASIQPEAPELHERVSL